MIVKIFIVIGAAVLGTHRYHFLCNIQVVVKISFFCIYSIFPPTHGGFIVKITSIPRRRADTLSKGLE
jgi:hypothetical protein